MSSKLFKSIGKKEVKQPLESVTRGVQDTHSKKPVEASKLKNPGKAKFTESLNNYNVVRDKVENEMRQVRSSTQEQPAKKRVSIGIYQTFEINILSIGYLHV